MFVAGVKEKGNPKKFSHENCMIPSPVPVELQNLIQFEEMLIGRAFPIIHVYTEPKGGQRAYKGHVITLPQDVQQLADVLRCCLADLPVVVFTVNGKDNASRDFTVRRKKVSDALHWLVRNNPLYSSIEIDYDRMEMLPEHRKLENIRKCNFISHSSTKETVTDRATNDNMCNDIRNHKDNDIIGDSDQLYDDNYNDYDDDHIDIDRGPIDLASINELVYDDNTEMTSFMPTAINQKKETDFIKDNINPDMLIKHPWKIETNPLKEYRTLSFPSLFPDAKSDPMNNALVRNISENETEAFSQKIKHLIKFAEKVNGKWVYRFASHPRFGCWAFNVLYRRRLLSQGNFFIKQNPGEANLTFEELQEMLSSGSHSTVMSKLMHYAKNVTGTNAYWNQTKEQLKATITQVGAPTIFWTLSCADFHWPEFHTLFSNETGSEQLRSNVINNPHLIDWLFTNRTEKFVKWWLYKSLGATWH